MAKNTKTVSFSLDPGTVERLEARIDAGSGENRSIRLAKDLDSFYALLALGLARVKRRLTQEEARLILDVQNGTNVDGSQISLWIGGGLAHQVKDGIELNGMDKTHGVDGGALLKKIEGMSDIEAIGVLDWAARFWGQEHDGEMDPLVEATKGFLEVY